MAGLVLEGGAFRGAYTDGVLDGLLDHNIMFDYVIGVSAEAANAFSYISRQRGRNIEILKKYSNDKRYIGAQNFIKHRSLFGLDFIYDEIPNRLIPFDYKEFAKYKGNMVSVLTDAGTGKSLYCDQSYLEPTFQLLRASCALPVLFPAIPFDGRVCYDGGLSDPIPIKKSVADGNDKNLIVLTREQGYFKSPPNTQSKLASNLIKSKYPNVSHLINTRHLKYNSTLKYIKTLKEQNTVILRPQKEVNVSRLEHDTFKLIKLYEQGLKDLEANIDKIKKII